MQCLSAYVLAIDCNGTAIFTDRQDGKGYELPGGCPETFDTNWLATACREFCEEVESVDWGLDDLTPLGQATLPSKKRAGEYGLAVYFSELPFLDTLKIDGWRSVDCKKNTSEVRGITLASWDQLPPLLIKFQSEAFIPVLDQILSEYVSTAHIQHFYRWGYQAVSSGIAHRAESPIEG